MTDVIFTRPELEALFDYAERMGGRARAGQQAEHAAAFWLRLRDKLAEACSQAHAIQAGHDAYLARLNAADAQYRRL